MNPEDFIGLTEADAQARATPAGYYIEVGIRDGVPCLMSDIGILDRQVLTVRVAGGLITAVSTNRFDD